MFERFAGGARRAVVLAQEEARERADPHIGPEHLLLGVAAGPATGRACAAALLARHGLDLHAVRRGLASIRAGEAEAPAPDGDREALASLGIDLDEVRARVESVFGSGALESTREAGRRRRGRRWGHIPFDRAAKDVLGLALDEARRRHDREVRTEHLLLGLLHDGSGRALVLLHAQGLTLDGVRALMDGRGDGTGGIPAAV